MLEELHVEGACIIRRCMYNCNNNIYIYRVAPKKYSSLIQYNLNMKRAITLKQEEFSSVMSNLNLDICRVYFNTVLAEIFGFENK